jgi:predicted PurR-regulated permease PerM
VSGNDVIQLTVRLGLLAFLTYWTVLLVRPFVPILAWSIVLAVAFYPAFKLLSNVLGNRPRLAAAILTAINLAIVIGPATWLGLGALEGVKAIAGSLGSGNLVVPSPSESVKDWPLIGSQLYELWDQASNNIRAALHDAAPYLKPFAGALLSFAGNAGIGMLKFLLSVAIAGFLFLHGPQLAAAGRSLFHRIVPDQSEHFLDLAGATIRAVSQGVIGIAVLQSLLVGIGLKLSGIPSAGLLAFAVLLLGILQLGAAIVLLPAIIWIWMDKEFTTALFLTIFLCIVGVLDNVLKPLVLGRGLTTPTLIVFVGVIGGTLAHGIIGLFIGPVILSLAWELIVAWIHTGSTESERRSGGQR